MDHSVRISRWTNGLILVCRWAGDQPACPLETRNSLINLLKGYAHQGAEWAQNSLSLQPCELWEIIKGRTLWFVGDSITQVGIWQSHHDSPVKTDLPP